MLFDSITNSGKNEVSTTVLINDIYKNNDTFYDVISGLNISKVDQQVISIPDKSNEFHGVVTATITTKNNNSYTGIGESYSSEKLPKEQVLQQAQLIAYKNAVCNAIISGNPHDSNMEKVIDIVPTKNIAYSNNKNIEQDKAKMNGGGNKPISQKQIELINAMAEQQGETGNSISNKVWHKNLNKLSGSQANRLINDLKEMPY